MNSILKIERISKTFASRTILNNLSLNVENGESVAIIGPSGSGKSTLLNVIGLLESYDSGHIYFRDKAYPKINSRHATLLRRNGINYLFQSFALISDLSTLANLDVALKYAKLEKSQKSEMVRSVLRELHIDHVADQPVSTLSGGEQQRAAIARAILKPGDLILADEPTGSLDKELAHTSFAQLLQMKEAFNKTIIVVTHDLEIGQQCDRMIDIRSLNQ